MKRTIENYNKMISSSIFRRNNYYYVVLFFVLRGPKNYDWMMGLAAPGKEYGTRRRCTV